MPVSSPSSPVPPVRSSVPQWLRRLVDADVIISVISLSLLVLIVAVQVFCRYVLQNSLDWTEELARYLLIWSVLFGCSYATKTDSHLEMAILRSLVGPRTGKGVHVFSCLVTALFCGIMIAASLDSIANIRWSEQLTPAMQIPAWYVWLAMPVGFGLMGVHAILRIVRILHPVHTPIAGEHGGAA